MPDFESAGMSSIFRGGSVSADATPDFGVDQVTPTSNPTGMEPAGVRALEKQDSTVTWSLSSISTSVPYGLALALQNDYPVSTANAYSSAPTGNRMIINFNQKALKDGIDLGALNSTIDTVIFIYDGTGLGTTIVNPTVYKMRAYRPNTNDYEVWVTVGYVNPINPSGQPIQPGSLTITVINLKELVGA